MSDLLKKLNLLIQASVNEVLDDAQRAVNEPLKRIPKAKLGRDIDNEVDKLRRKVNDALAYEDELVSRVAELEREVAELDEQADEAVQRGQDAQAHYLIDRMNRAQQRLHMAESDLKAHRIAAQELIMRVNQLDAAVSEARHVEEKSDDRPATPSVKPRTTAASSKHEDTPQQRLSTQKSPTSPPQPTRIPVEREEVPAPTSSPPTKLIPVQIDDEPVIARPAQSEPVTDEIPEATEAQRIVERTRQQVEQSGRVLSDVLREAREKVEQMDELLDVQQQSQGLEPSVTEQVDDVLKKDAIDQDIAARRARLSGPPKRPTDSSSDT